MLIQQQILIQTRFFVTKVSTLYWRLANNIEVSLTHFCNYNSFIQPKQSLLRQLWHGQKNECFQQIKSEDRVVLIGVRVGRQSATGEATRSMKFNCPFMVTGQERKDGLQNIIDRFNSYPCSNDRFYSLEKPVGRCTKIGGA